MPNKKSRKRSDKPAKRKFAKPKVIVNKTVKDLEELGEVKKTKKERIGWAKKILDVPKIWHRTKVENIKVAVLDTGVDPNHPDLKDAIIAKRDYTGDGIEDEDGHGTHCAGIIAARKNKKGFVGVAPKAELLIAKVLDNKGEGEVEWICKGINWAKNRGADIISMSLGFEESDSDLYSTIQKALAAGVFIICAAGNEGGFSMNNIGYPARYGGVITVASHDEDGNRSGFSSSGGELDVMAPGTDIWSTYKKGEYASLSGTSMATPFVAGLGALIASKHKSKDKNKTPLDNNEDLKTHLLRMAAHPGSHDNQTGYGPLKPFQYFDSKRR